MGRIIRYSKQRLHELRQLVVVDRREGGADYSTRKFISLYTKYLAILYSIWEKHNKNVDSFEPDKSLFIPRVNGVQYIFPESVLSKFNTYIVTSRDNIRADFPEVRSLYEFNAYNEDEYETNMFKIFVQIIHFSYESDFVIPWNANIFCYAHRTSDLAESLIQVAEEIIRWMDGYLVRSMGGSGKDDIEDFLQTKYNITTPEHIKHAIRYLRMGRTIEDIKRDFSQSR